jgi:hypothetical protein
MICKFECKDSVKRKDLITHYDEFAKIHADKMLKEYKILHERSIEKDKIMALGNDIINELDEKIDNISKYVKTIIHPGYDDMDSFEHYDKVHKGFGNYEYYMHWSTYNSIINKVSDMIKK